MSMDWLGKVAGVLRGIRTPLSLGGLAIIVLCVVYNRILDLGIFSTIDAAQTSQLITAMVGFVFWLAVVAVILGGIGYMVRPGVPEPVNAAVKPAGNAAMPRTRQTTGRRSPDGASKKR